jgi:hypothetical protein
MGARGVVQAMTLRLLVLPAALAIVLATPAAATHIPWEDPALPGRIDCGVADDFPLENLRGPADAERGTDEPAAELRRLISGEEPIMGGGPFPKSGYRVLDRSGERVVYAAGHGRRLFHVAVNHEPNGEWDIGVVGSCAPAPSDPDGTVADWELRPGAPAPGPRTRRLRIRFMESACASGRPATRRVLEPRVFVDRRRVVVAVFVRPVAGPANCPGNPYTRYTVRLPRPLGSRTLLDGATLPAHAERRRP